MRTALTAIIVLVFGLSAFVFAQTTDESPRLPAVKNAIKQYEVAAEKARKEYLMALIDLDRRLIADMEGALKQVMQAGNLDEAKRIEAAVLTAKETMGKHQDELRGKPAVHEFVIDARKNWQTTVEVKAGQRVEVRARGEWCADRSNPAKWTCGPDGMRHHNKNIPAFYLEGRIDNGEAFRVGSAYEFIANQSGVISFRMMETGNRSDNTGSVSIQLSIFHR